MTPTETTASSSSSSTSTATPVPQTSAPQPTATQTSSSVGGTVGLFDALDEAIRLYEELFDALASVTDEASARAAVDDVTRIINQFEELDKRKDDDYTDAEIASAALSSRFFDIGQDLNVEMMRLAANPAVFMLLAEAFEDLENLNSPDSVEAAEDGKQPSGGSAILIIGDETWMFNDIFCGFTPDETRNSRVSFTLVGFGESTEGRRTQLDATIQGTDNQGRYSGFGVIHSVSLNDIENFENPSVAWEAIFGLLKKTSWATGRPHLFN